MSRMSDLLSPGLHRAGGVADDAALLAAMLRVEVAWSARWPRSGRRSGRRMPTRSPADRAAVRPGGAGRRMPRRPATRSSRWWRQLRRSSATCRVRGPPGPHQPGRPRHRSGAGRPRRTGPRERRPRRDRQRAGGAWPSSTGDTVMVGRTLTQHAVPITFGLKAAPVAVRRARMRRRQVADVADRLPGAGRRSRRHPAAARRTWRPTPTPPRSGPVRRGARAAAGTRLPWHTRQRS